MNKIRKLSNPVQEYAWGSRSAIAGLLGEPVPSPVPQAELWMGTHPKAPSLVEHEDGTVPLTEWIKRDPISVLGPRAAVAFSRELPFLFKVLAAAQPLSIQAHPDMDQAREGFDRENEAGIPLSAPERNYRDPNHKPELICALTPFWALNGFRPPEAILPLADRLGIGELASSIGASSGLARFFTDLMTMDPDRRKRLVGSATEAARALAAHDPVFDWMVKLSYEFPDDPGILSPIFLNLVRLEPGQAMALPSRRLHAYLDGTGIEIMANSDNVLRGGLTVKHVDVDELVRVLAFEPSDPGVEGPRRVSDTESSYRSDAREFLLSRIDVAPPIPHTSSEERTVEILVCTAGSGRIDEMHSGYWLDVERGASFLVPASSGPYKISGEVTLYRASVPI